MPLSNGQARAAGFDRASYELFAAPVGTWTATLDWPVWALQGCGLHIYLTDENTWAQHWLFVPAYDPLREVLRHAPRGSRLELTTGRTRNGKPKLLACEVLSAESSAGERV